MAYRKLPHTDRTPSRFQSLSVFLILAALNFISLGHANESSAQQEFKITHEKSTLVINLSDVQYISVIKSRSLGPLKDRLIVRLASEPDIRILGKASYDEKKRQLRFTPRFPFDPGTKLSIEVTSVLGSKFIIPGGAKPKKSSVVQIYPTADKLPANLLKFYVHFSQPMQKGNIYQHFSIFDVEKNKRVEIPFLELEEELWSRDGKRLTLFFDPGRIKRGLKPRQDLGPIFMADKKYQFRISGKWKDQNGNLLGDDIVKEFETTREDHQPPAYQTWKTSISSNDGKTKLTVDFDEPLDSALCQRVIQLEVNQRPIQTSSLTLQRGERQLVLHFDWLFPQKSNLILRIGSELEDLCGNRIGKPFDFDPKKDKPANESKSFTLEVK